jgi:hypothetical protein
MKHKVMLKVNLSEIIVPGRFVNSTQSAERVEERKNAYLEHLSKEDNDSLFFSHICVDDSMELVKGYVDYMAATECNAKEVAVELVGERTLNLIKKRKLLHDLRDIWVETPGWTFCEMIMCFVNEYDDISNVKDEDFIQEFKTILREKYQIETDK